MHVREARLVVAAFVLQNHGVGGAVRRPAVGTQAAATEKRSLTANPISTLARRHLLPRPAGAPPARLPSPHAAAPPPRRAAGLPTPSAPSNRRRRRRRPQQQQARPEIPSWGRRRSRKVPVAPPAEKPAPYDDRSEGAASLDTPEDDEHDQAVAAEDEAKASAQDKGCSPLVMIQQLMLHFQINKKGQTD
ncbi:uncharacterized protein [Aegilops tauschii subsp. strangulata]|uniref:uncharacterized protein n=1 Tax=Aegilops tauschii subsp. strangulata TaxID=200361 RepID=UPI001E1CAA86|nr:dapper homolog 3 [Aegilops tauschii subsp. strangulata]